MIEVTSVKVLQKTENFLHPFKFELVFTNEEFISNNELEWRIIYGGSAKSQNFDQVLFAESFGPFQSGEHNITLCSSSVDPHKLPAEEFQKDPSGVLFLLGYFRRRQIFQVGFYVFCDLPEDDIKRLEEGDIDINTLDFNAVNRRVLEGHPVQISYNDGDSTVSDIACLLSFSVLEGLALSVGN